MLALCAAVLAGCQGPARRAQALDQFNMLNTPLPIDRLVSDYTPEDLSNKPVTDEMSAHRYAVRAMFQQYLKARQSNATEARAWRDRITMKVMTHIKHYHQGTSDDLFETASFLETAFDFVGIAMGSLGAIHGGTASQALSGAAAGAIGGRSALVKNILAEQTKFAILHQMEALRTQKEADIVGKLATESDAAYPLEAAVSDLYSYFAAGSLKDAVTALAKAAADAKDQADRELAAAARQARASASIDEARNEMSELIARASKLENKTKGQELIDAITSKFTVLDAVIEARRELQKAKEAVQQARSQAEVNAQAVATAEDQQRRAEQELNKADLDFQKLRIDIEKWKSELPKAPAAPPAATSG